MLAGSFLVVQVCISFFEVFQTRVAHFCFGVVRIKMLWLHVEKQCFPRVVIRKQHRGPRFDA